MEPKEEKPNSTHESKIGANPPKPKKKNRAQLKHELKLELMRTCKIYGKSYEESKAYFKLRGYELGETTFTDLRNELKSHDAAKGWFSNEALYAIEEDHQLSVERLRMMEDRLLKEFEQLAATNYYKYIGETPETQELIKNKAHDVHALLRVISTFQSIQETKNKMFSATPLVQEIMEVHARQEEEDSKPKPHKIVKAPIPKIVESKP